MIIYIYNVGAVLIFCLRSDVITMHNNIVTTVTRILFIDALAHNFKQTTGSRFSIQQCEVCHKGFTGFMKQALRCVGK